MLLAVCAVPSPVISQEISSAPLATAGRLSISAEEFLVRFEFFPAPFRHRKGQLEAAKLDLLYTLIAEKLLAQEALERGFQRDSAFQQAYFNVKKLIVRDHLYRQEVVARVVVREDEIAEGMSRLKNQLFIRFVYFDSKEVAKAVRADLKQMDDFERLFSSGRPDIVCDSVTVTWGEAEPSLEAVAFGLSVGDISPVVEAGSGYYVFTLDAVESHPQYAALDVAALRQRVMTTLRARKERERAFHVAGEILKERTAHARGEPFRRLALALREAFQRSAPATGCLWLDRDLVRAVRERCRPWLNDTLVIMADNAWTMGEVIDRLYLKNFSIEPKRVQDVAAFLNDEIRGWIEQEFFALEGLRRGLDALPAVQRELEMWYHHLLAEGMKEHIRRTVDVDEREVLRILQKSDSNAPLPRVRVRELWTSSIEEMGEALAMLDAGASFEEAVVRWSVDTRTVPSRGESTWFSITERSPIGEIAWTMDVGERFGPIPLEDRYLLFELVEKDVMTTDRASTFVARKEMTRNELLRRKQKEAIDEFIAKLAATRGVEIYAGRLQQIRVASSPAMALRLLGFGGRMLAVPASFTNTDWVFLNPAAVVVIP